MKLKFDPDYQREIDVVKQRVLAAGSQSRWLTVGLTAVLLIATIWITDRTNVSDGLSIAAVIAVATVCLIWVIEEQTRTLHASLTIIVGAIEWFEKKKLGEVIDD